MHSKKLVAFAASLAVAVPASAAQATHDSGKLGAPGQVCKPLLKARQAQVKAFRNQDPKPTNAQVREFRQQQQQAYKGCVKAAADARSHEDSGTNGVSTQQDGDRSATAPGQVCKPLLRARQAQMRQFRSQDPKPPRAAVKAFRKQQQVAYKGCIKAAADARSDEDDGGSTGGTQA